MFGTGAVHVTGRLRVAAAEIKRDVFVLDPDGQPDRNHPVLVDAVVVDKTFGSVLAIGHAVAMAARICFSEASKTWSMARLTWSGPYLFNNDRRLRSPRVTAPTSQCRSPSTRNGRCTFSRMVSHNALFGLPASYNLAGGIRMHSSHTLLASGLYPATPPPPTSAWWPLQMVQNSRLPL